ncbi:unnamed protein product [Amoebophrya sp. A120]|nr:unnamed protein product [Amoebophrya sp. A120]|eukprot:GSA120T00008658001.1
MSGIVTTVLERDKRWNGDGWAGYSSRKKSEKMSNQKNCSRRSSCGVIRSLREAFSCKAIKWRRICKLRSGFSTTRTDVIGITDGNKQTDSTSKTTSIKMLNTVRDEFRRMQHKNGLGKNGLGRG